MIKRYCTMSPSRHESHWPSFDANTLWRGLAYRPVKVKKFSFRKLFSNNFTSPVTIFEIATSAKRRMFYRIYLCKIKNKNRHSVADVANDSCTNQVNLFDFIFILWNLFCFWKFGDWEKKQKIPWGIISTQIWARKSHCRGAEHRFMA